MGGTWTSGTWFLPPLLSFFRPNPTSGQICLLELICICLYVWASTCGLNVSLPLSHTPSWWIISTSSSPSQYPWKIFPASCILGFIVTNSEEEHNLYVIQPRGNIQSCLSLFAAHWVRYSVHKYFWHSCLYNPCQWISWLAWDGGPTKMKYSFQTYCWHVSRKEEWHASNWSSWPKTIEIV